MRKKLLPYSSVSFTLSQNDINFESELERLVYNDNDTLNAIYIRIPDNMISGNIIETLRQKGFKYYDFDSECNMFVYYIWTGPGHDKVPTVCTSIGGACAAVKSPDGKAVLLIKEKVGDEILWKLPGGAIDLRESFVNGAIREATEETGVEINKSADIYLLGGYSKGDARPGGRNDQFLCFGMRASTKILKQNDGEAIECRWFGLTKLRSELKKKCNNVISPKDHARSRIEILLAGTKNLFNLRDLNWACSYYDEGLSVKRMSNGVWVYTN